MAIGPLKKPGLPPGALRELNEALHELHLRAGWPTCPKMAKDSITEYSKSAIHAVFSNQDLPSQKVVRELAHHLAELADQDPEEEVYRFRELWISAAQEVAVVGGGEGPPLKPAPGSGLPKVQELHRADGPSALPPQRDVLPTEPGLPQAGSARLEPYSADWLEVVEWALSAVLLSLFPKKSEAYRFLSESGVPSEYYVVGDPSTIRYWVGIVEHVRSKSSTEGLERLIKSAAKNSEGSEQRLRTFLQVTAAEYLYRLQATRAPAGT
jgi:hypothetical protein